MIALVLSYLPSWLVSWGAAMIGAAGIAAIVYSLLPLAPYRRSVQIAGTIAIGWALYQTGLADAQAVREVQVLREQVAERDRALTERDRLIQEQNTKIAEVAGINRDLYEGAALLDGWNEGLQRDLQQKKDELAARPAASRPRLSDADVRRMRDVAKRAASVPKGR